MTHGWSVTITQGYEIGGDAAGGKYIGGIELGATESIPRRPRGRWSQRSGLLTRHRSTCLLVK